MTTYRGPPLSVNLLTNDIRPPHSAPLAWFVQAAIEVWNDVPAETVETPQSRYYFMIETPLALVPQGQTLHVGTVMLPVSGELVDTTYHVMHTHAYNGTERTENFAPLIRYGLLLKAGGVHAVQKLRAAAHNHTALNPAMMRASARQEEDVVCEARTRVGGALHFSRKPSVRCHPWRFQRGDLVTAIAVLDSASSMTVVNFHHQWLLWYVADDHRPHFTAHTATTEAAAADCIDTPLARTEVHAIFVLALHDASQCIMVTTAVSCAVFVGVACSTRRNAARAIASAVAINAMMLMLATAWMLRTGILRRNMAMEYVTGDDAIVSCRDAGHAVNEALPPVVAVASVAAIAVMVVLAASRMLSRNGVSLL
tara:strand:+ start:8465 stop:9568 length:1104 start_codon:yes stop_codon:yes gene_type:complete